MAKWGCKWGINGAHDASDAGCTDSIPEIWTSFPACDLRISKYKSGYIVLETIIRT